ncbi:hypothetical protein CH306_02195 [Rhodococcus sp. 15-725-2-2b]|nr:hypothetical protein CH277_00470 [Rhodococcus sp. 06-469-3-2]OZD48737.1 hypothetical protein CH264_05695 [Rhodococcus sp. 06-1477-1A]OZE77521.1 hypothetical protein CH306_02195 [Rhodococcus sp. 15-725-2-2b]
MRLVVTGPHAASIVRTLSVHPIPWLSGTDRDCPVSEDRRQFGVTRVSQVGTFAHGRVRTLMYEKRCK